MRTFMERQAARPLQESDIMPIVRHWLVKRRFEKKFIPEPNCGCWIWTGASGVMGHGQFFVRKSTKRKGLIGAHRVSWMLYRGDLSASDIVCHSCDFPPCVNPDHLFVGTHADNSRDAATKGRLVLPDTIGEANSAAVLHEEDVLYIRSSKSSLADLADRFGVTKTCVHEARCGVTWQHLPGAIPSKKRGAAFSDSERRLILSRSMPDSEIAAMLGRTKAAIQTARYHFKSMGNQ